MIVSDGYGVLASPSEAGDEPYLLATSLSGLAAVISSADRIAAGQEAIKDFGSDCFVLDDGFQHLRLARDLNIVTIDATNPWGGGTLLPYGRLRENPEGLRRADCVVITRCDLATDLDALRNDVARLIDNRPIFHSHMRTLRVSPLKNGAGTLAPPARIAAFCAVGNPSSFVEHLGRSGYELALTTTFPDHHVYSQDEIDSITRSAQNAGATALITTAKDAVKLRSMAFSIPCYVLEIEISIEHSEELTQLIVGASQSAQKAKSA